MLPQAHRDQIEVVLISPRNPLNIGAAARAMANFGFGRLAVVAPFAEHWREARSAVGAPEILHNAEEYSTLSGAIARSTLVIGTGTLAARKPEQPIVSLSSLAPLVETELRRGGHVAMIFGSEKRGLTREDFSCCHLHVHVPTDVRQPSMNLGQAVAVCLYELATRMFQADESSAVPMPLGESSAPGAALDLLAEVIDSVMVSATYSPPIMRSANRRDVRLLLRRLSINQSDAKRTLRFFRRVLWQIERRRH